MPRSLFSRRTFGYASAITATGSAVMFLTRPPFDVKTSEIAPLVLPRSKDGTLLLPKYPTVKRRDEHVADLKHFGGSQRSSGFQASPSDEVYDLLVIGGGATGTGIALDAATRGLKVALVERDDFSSGTSSRSTKLVHGGVRYLEKAVWNLDYNQYELVKEALRERKNFLAVAPHLTSWTPVMLPIQRWWQAPYFWAGTKAYDLLAGSESNPSSYFLTRGRALSAFPMLKTDDLVGALVYYDGQQNDSRMNVSLAMTAAHYGATIANYVEVTSLEKDANGNLCGARLRDLISKKDDGSEQGEEFLVRAKGIINATGPFADAIHQMDEAHKKELIAPSSGVHIVLPRRFSPKRMGLIDPSTSDGRVMFLLPWEGNVIAGTTDSPCSVERDPLAREEDIGWILREIRKHLNADMDLQREDVLAAWSGIRPLVRDPNAKNTESLVRNHLVHVSKSGLLTCAGGKWTTYRQMAEDAVDKAIKVFNLQPEPGRLADIPNINGLPNTPNDTSLLNGTCQTLSLRLLGAHGYSPVLSKQLSSHFQLEAEIAEHLAHSYGDRAWDVAAGAASSPAKISPNYPFLVAEVPYAIHNESAQTAIDFLARRTRLSFLDARAALEALPKVIDVMGEELHWSNARKELEWRESVRFLGSMGLETAFWSVTRDEVLDGRARRKEPRRMNAGSKTVDGSREPVPTGSIEIPVRIAARGA